jgi:diguanylate cyclase (GGDEF)-like protein
LQPNQLSVCHKTAQSELFNTLEKRQFLAAISTAVLACVISLTVFKPTLGNHILLWNACIFLLSCYKIILSQYRKYFPNRIPSDKTRESLLLVSAACSGVLWSIPVFFVSQNNLLELSIVALIVSGIITGAVNAYLGKPSCMACIVFFPTTAIVYWILHNMTPIPAPAIACIITYNIYTLMISFDTFHDAVNLFLLKTENNDLIDELKATQQKMRDLANRDALTCLPNRRLLIELFEHSISNAERNSSKVAILYIDINDFKPVNDRYGHNIGDKVLISIAHILKNTLRTVDVLARIGGDEFVAVIEEIQSLEDAVIVAKKIIGSLQKPVTIQNHNIKVSVSVGIAVYPDHGHTLHDLVALSDAAMYAAKKEKSCYYAVHH